MNFIGATKICLKKYFIFSGKASRSEFWYFFLFLIILNLVCLFIDLIIGYDIEELGPVTSLYILLFIIPLISASSRRLHDTGRSGWWYLLVLTGIGSILLVYWWSSKKN